MVNQQGPGGSGPGSGKKKKPKKKAGASAGPRSSATGDRANLDSTEEKEPKKCLLETQHPSRGDQNSNQTENVIRNKSPEPSVKKPDVVHKIELSAGPERELQLQSSKVQLKPPNRTENVGVPELKSKNSQSDQKLKESASETKPEKTKAEIKAERRAKQEADRARKAQTTLNKGKDDFSFVELN